MAGQLTWKTNDDVTTFLSARPSSRDSSLGLYWAPKTLWTGRYVSVFQYLRISMNSAQIQWRNGTTSLKHVPKGNLLLAAYNWTTSSLLPAVLLFFRRKVTFLDSVMGLWIICEIKTQKRSQTTKQNIKSAAELYSKYQSFCCILGGERWREGKLRTHEIISKGGQNHRTVTEPLWIHLYVSFSHRV